MIVGAVLAGGLGRRMGGGKPGRLLGGRPLVAWPAAALGSVCSPVALVARAGEPLPVLPGVERWDEPAEAPRHPLTGIVFALSRAGGSRVLVCAGDMPFVTPSALSSLVAAPGCVVAVADGVLQPVLGVYSPVDLDALRRAPPDAPLTRTVEALSPTVVELPGDVVRSVDTPEELAAAEAELG